MGIQCPSCLSENTQKRGTRVLASGEVSQRGYCNNCRQFFAVRSDLVDEGNAGLVKSELNFIRDPDYIADLQSYSKFVVTAATNNSKVNFEFFSSLRNYCRVNDAALVIIPIMYRNPSLFNPGDDYWFDQPIMPYLVENNFQIADRVRILGGLKTQATAANPLTGIESVSKGNTVIIGHSQVALKTLPRLTETYPAIAVTTGCITDPSYSDTKVGYVANFNHSESAVLIELDAGIGEHFVRHLNWDGDGFYDFDKYYTPDGVTEECEVDALIMGDLHAKFRDEGVEAATFTNIDSICNVLKPKSLILGDSLDFYSQNHHHQHNIFTKYAKHLSGDWCVKKELDETLAYIQNITPDYATCYIVASNHNDALRRWLNEADIKKDMQNALIYHLLVYKMLEKTKMTESGASSPDPFALYADYVGVNKNIQFLKRDESLLINGVECSLHGDVGQNGARGSLKAFSNMANKYVVGHGHSPGIDKGAYMVGTSSRLKLEYNRSGPSSWDFSHVVIYPNGKKQMIFIREGKWRSN